MLQPIRPILHWLARPVLLHWIMPYLMALIAAGTVAQKYIGLYQSQNQFFSSFILWAGIIPLPGGRTVCALLLISLLAKLTLASPWRKATSGIFIAHLGVLLLLLGGLLTAAFSREGYMALAPGDNSHVFSDYHARQLTISKNGAPLVQLPLDSITTGKTITPAPLPFTLRISALCRNCTMAMRTGSETKLHGPAKKIMLSPLDEYLEDERNLAGAEISIAGAGPENDGAYIAFEPMEKQPSFTLGSDSYTIALSRTHYSLPFSLELLSADKEVHPGTDTPRSYRSTVILRDGAIEQRAILTMNHPLRYKGYTVYQASFNEGGGVSFAVVKNSGRVFPYVASITLCIGLLLHLFLRLPALIKRGQDAP